MKLRKNDIVEVIAGKDRGKRGKIVRMFPADNKVSVEGVAIVTKHAKPRRGVATGERIQYPGRIDVSNVMLVCPHTDKPTRIGYKVTDGGVKVRVSRRSGKEL